MNIGLITILSTDKNFVILRWMTRDLIADKWTLGLITIISFDKYFVIPISEFCIMSRPNYGYFCFVKLYVQHM